MSLGPTSKVRSLSNPAFPMITIIVATDLQGAIGFENHLLFHMPADMRHFKSLTTGHTVLMGRKTFDSLPKGALPNRRNLVLSRDKNLKIEGAETFTSMKEALESCKEDEQVFIMGGESIYRQAMAFADTLELTLIKTIAPEADAFFPEVSPEIWHETARTEHAKDEKNPYDYVFITLERT